MNFIYLDRKCTAKYLGKEKNATKVFFSTTKSFRKSACEFERTKNSSVRGREQIQKTQIILDYNCK